MMAAKKGAKSRTGKRGGKSPKKRNRASATVLIVDDDPDFAQGLTGLFEQAQFDVACASNVDAAVRLLRRGVFDVIIVDMRMPEKRGQCVDLAAGLGLLRLLQRFGLKQPDAIVVLFTAYPSVRDCFAAIEAGAYYLPKVVPGINVSEQLVGECRRFVDEKRKREHDPKRIWLSDHYDQLVEEFGGQTVAIVDAETAKEAGLEGGKTIGDRTIFAAPNAEELQKRILSDERFLLAMPLIIDVLEEPLPK